MSVTIICYLRTTKQYVSILIRPGLIIIYTDHCTIAKVLILGLYVKQMGTKGGSIATKVDN